MCLKFSSYCNIINFCYFRVANPSGTFITHFLPFLPLRLDMRITIQMEEYTLQVLITFVKSDITQPLIQVAFLN